MAHAASLAGVDCCLFVCVRCVVSYCLQQAVHCCWLPASNLLEYYFVVYVCGCRSQQYMYSYV